MRRRAWSRMGAGVGDLEGVQPVEGDGTQPGEAHAGLVRLGQRPDHHLEQCLQRCRAQTAAQIPQRLLRRPGRFSPASPAVSLPHTRA